MASSLYHQCSSVSEHGSLSLPATDDAEHDDLPNHSSTNRQKYIRSNRSVTIHDGRYNALITDNSEIVTHSHSHRTGTTTHEPTSSSSSVPLQAILCVLGGFIIHLCVGVLYTWSVITAPVTSYLRQYESDITYNDTILIYSISLFIQASSMVLGGLLSDASMLGVKKCCLLGSGFLILSMLLVGLGACCCSDSSSRRDSHSDTDSDSIQSSLESFFNHGLTKMIIFYSFPFGLGIGLTYTPPIAASVRWLPQWKGLLTGIIMCGLGIGAMFFGFLCTALVNPNHDNVESDGPDKGYFPAHSDVVQRVPRMFQGITACFLILLPVGCCLVNEPPVTQIVGDQKGIESNEDDVEPSTINPMQRIRDTEGGTERDDDEDVEISFSAVESSTHDDHGCEMRGMGESRHALLVTIENETEREGQNQNIPHERDTGRVAGHESHPNNHKTMREIACTSLAWHVILCFFCTTGGGMYLLGSFKTLAQQQIHNEAFLATIGSLSTLANSSGRIIWGIVSDSSVGTVNTLLYAIAGFVVVLFTFPTAVTLGGEVGFAFWALLIFFFEASNFAIYFPIVVMLFGTTHAASNYGFVVTCYSSFFMLLSYIIAKGEFEMQGVCYIIGSVTFCGFLSLLFLKWRIKSRDSE